MIKNLTIEIAQFKLVPGTEDAGFLKAADVVQKNFLRKQKGFVDRELSKSDDGQWVDILHWKTMQDALKASEEMLKNPSCLDFIQKIDPTSVTMTHVRQVKTYH